VAPNIKNSKPKGLLNPVNWNTRVPDNADGTFDYFTKQNCSFHNFVYAGLQYIDQTGATQAISNGSYNGSDAIILCVGPYNEITLQKVGAGTVTVKGSLTNDVNSLVSCNTVTSSDGFIRIQSLYKFISIEGSSLDSTSALYLQIW
jgi:hypothetical protein